jgi:mercuric ion binding protein
MRRTIGAESSACDFLVCGSARDLLVGVSSSRASFNVKGTLVRVITKLIAFALLPVASAYAASQSAVLDLQNMTCSLCSVTVKKALQKVPGVEDTKIDYDTKTATIKYDPNKTNVTALVKASTDAGFPSTPHK